MKIPKNALEMARLTAQALFADTIGGEMTPHQVPEVAKDSDGSYYFPVHLNGTVFKVSVTRSL